MSNGDQGIDTSLLPGISDDEAAQLGQMFASITKECESPKIQLAIPTEAVAEIYKYICGILRGFGAPLWIARFVASFFAAIPLTINVLVSVLLAVMAPAIDVLFKEALSLLDTLRKELDPQFAELAVLVLNELLGTDFTTSHLASGIDVGSHIQRAGVVGGLLHDQLTREFSSGGQVDVVPSPEAARRMSGFLINFGTATGILATLGGLVPGVHLDEIREIGEEVARNLGLGRLHRQVMKPLITTLIATPYQWWLNQRYHPTQFREGDLINPFTQQLMSTDLIFKQMDLLGYSQDKIEALIKLHQKRLAVSDAELLLRYEIWTGDQAREYVKTLGYPDELASLVLYLQDIHRGDTALTNLLSAIEQRVADGQVSVADYTTLLDNLPLGQYEKRFRLQAAQFKVKAPSNHLTLAQAQSALEEGVWDLNQFETYLTARGYSLDDTQTLEILTLLKLAKQSEAKSVAQFKYDQAVTKAQSKNLPIPPKPAILAS